jgi:hypothetical protein
MRQRGTQEPGVVDAMNVGALGATKKVAIDMFHPAVSSHGVSFGVLASSGNGRFRGSRT